MGVDFYTCVECSDNLVSDCGRIIEIDTPSGSTVKDGFRCMRCYDTMDKSRILPECHEHSLNIVLLLQWKRAHVPEVASTTMLPTPLVDVISEYYQTPVAVRLMDEISREKWTTLIRLMEKCAYATVIRYDDCVLEEDEEDRDNRDTDTVLDEWKRVYSQAKAIFNRRRHHANSKANTFDEEWFEIKMSKPDDVMSNLEEYIREPKFVNEDNQWFEIPRDYPGEVAYLETKIETYTNSIAEIKKKAEMTREKLSSIETSAVYKLALFECKYPAKNVDFDYKESKGEEKKEEEEEEDEEEEKSSKRKPVAEPEPGVDDDDDDTADGDLATPIAAEPTTTKKSRTK